MAEISADFRPARMEEIYEIARRLHWKIVQEEEKWREWQKKRIFL